MRMDGLGGGGGGAYQSSMFGVDIDAAARKIQSVWKMFQAKKTVQRMLEEERELLGLSAPDSTSNKQLDVAKEQRKILQRQNEMQLMVERSKQREELRGSCPPPP